MYMIGMPTIGQARETIFKLLARRQIGATICPSEVARALAAQTDPGDSASAWRDEMPLVHVAIDQLAAERRVQLRWKGRQLAARAAPIVSRLLPRGKAKRAIAAAASRHSYTARRKPLANHVRYMFSSGYGTVRSANARVDLVDDIDQQSGRSTQRRPVLARTGGGPSRPRYPRAPATD